jgi:hypothetical protein
MPTMLNPQEIYLLERYSSIEYYEKMYNAWRAMLDHVERCYAKFMTQLPPDYRNRPVPEQPDVVWGQMVLPNFRNTMISLENGYLLMQRGDKSGTSASISVEGDVRGQREYWEGWMDEVAPEGTKKYFDFLGDASHYAGNVHATYSAFWSLGELTSNYWESGRGPLNPPPTWPVYRLNKSVTVKTGDIVPQTGIYLPMADDSCAEFLVKGREAIEANVGYDPKRMQNVSEIATTWTLVERIADSSEEPATKAAQATQRLRCPAGQMCPQEGFWFTPAKADSRRRFKAGEVMPSLGGDYGETIWQWDERQ